MKRAWLTSTSGRSASQPSAVYWVSSCRLPRQVLVYPLQFWTIIYSAVVGLVINLLDPTCHIGLPSIYFEASWSREFDWFLRLFQMCCWNQRYYEYTHQNPSFCRRQPAQTENAKNTVKKRSRQYSHRQRSWRSAIWLISFNKRIKYREGHN